MIDKTAPEVGEVALGDSLRSFVVHALDGMQGRLELLKLDLRDEKDRVVGMLARGLFAAFFMFLSIQLFAVLIVASVWNTEWRIPVIAGLATAAVVATALLIRAFKSTPDSTMFESNVDTMAKDVRTLHGIQ